MQEPVAWSQRVKSVAAGVGAALAITLSASWWKIYTEHAPPCILDYCVADFVIFYAQPLMVRENARALYDLDQQLAFQKRFVTTERVLIFPYPPITAALLVPFTLLSFSAAFLAMTVVNAGLLWATLRRLIRELNLTRDQTQWLLIATLCNFGIQATLSNGVLSILMLHILTRHVLAQRRGNQIESGLWAGLLCLKLQYLALPHLVLLLQRAWRSFLIGAVLATSLVGGGFLLLGWRTLLQYLEIVSRYSGFENDWAHPVRGMHNLKALAAVWLPASWSALAWLVMAGAVLVGVVWINRQTQRLSKGFEIRWIGNCLALLLLSPHLFTHDLSLLVVPAAMLFSIWGECTPVWLGVLVVIVSLLPAINYLLPTIMAATLLISFVFSLRLANIKRFQIE